MQTTSSRVMDYLKNLPEGATFNTVSIRQDMPDASSGGISGMMNRLLKEKAIALVERGKSFNGRLIDSYRVVDLSNVNIKDTFNGRAHSSRTHAGTSTREHLSGLLLQIASEIEQMKGSLCDFSTEELLKEIGRRMKNQQQQ
jgi:hypothetical protein